MGLQLSFVLLIGVTNTRCMPTRTVDRPALAAVVNIDRYPLGHRDDARLLEVIERARRDLANVGCARIPAFIRPEAQSCLTDETTSVAPLAYRVSREITPYSDHGDSELPADHPRRRLGAMTNGFVGKDRIPDGVIKALYSDHDFERFVAACLSLEVLHPFADPIRGLVVNVMDDGTQMPWHYDANEFIVSLMTRRPDAGGAFEFCPDLRVPGDERYDDVRSVLDGDRERVRTLDLEVGDLQLFRGRYSMHRVTPTRGERHTVLLGYSETPGYIGGVESTLIGYGRVTQEHLDAEQGHVDGLAG